MLYRIRYGSPGQGGDAEIAIEANSPTEAIVKFRHMRSGRAKPGQQQDDVMSVSVDPLDEQFAW